MAGYGCAYDDTCPNPINILYTNMDPSFTLSLCDEHAAVGLVPIVASNLGVDPGKLYETVKRFVDREAAREAKEAATTTPAEQAQDDPNLPDDPDRGFTPEDNGPLWAPDDAEAMLDDPEPES